MKYQILNGFNRNQPIEKKCSRLIMGSGGFHQFKNKNDIYDILNEFIKLGGNVLDTAHQYIDSERILGEWLSGREDRSDIYILTKGAHPDDGEPGNRVNPKSITKDINESLERLGTDYIDFYALHRDDESVPVGPIIELLNEHIASGKIHAIGTSNWSYQRIHEANLYADKNGLIGFMFNSPNLSLAKSNEPRWPGCVSVDDEMLNWHSGNQLPLFAWSSQAGGFFSGNFSPEIRENEEIVRVYYSEDNWERYRRAEKLAEEKEVSTIQIALAYVLNQDFPTAAIIGPEKIAELVSSIEGAEIGLTKQEVDWLDLQANSMIGSVIDEA
ncbi:aldo/keto reductase [Virgibacillus litoralis]|uniref:Aryl-alcohol dehydrogenase-like predicted oxidoreductase n=1 Tax=Virgibacillus litoralis TaxID=578221 RepID=A0ABS4HAE7_9BACI|nr:aldo/keto reductase [Virgibacillus litoralis]MBP1947877.1 aryl-alcohol dehydrogenase-like predicted oxidoreductase [Virgibacillus litoralis]